MHEHEGQRHVSAMQWHRKMFCCKGAENRQCTIVIRLADRAYNDVEGSRGMLFEEILVFHVSLSQFCILRAYCMGLIHVD